jgi:hypothetical protein
MEYLLWLAFSVLVLGLFLNQFIKDSIWPLSAVYYGLPINVLLLGSIGYCAISFRSRIHRLTAPALLIVVILLAIFVRSGTPFTYLGDEKGSTHHFILSR